MTSVLQSSMVSMSEIVDENCSAVEMLNEIQMVRKPENLATVGKQVELNLA